MTHVGIWADGMEEENMSGPWLALYRTLQSANFTPIDITLFQTSPSKIIPHDRFGEQVVEKSLTGRLNLDTTGYDIIFTNGIPATFPSYVFHTYPHTLTTCWVHGTLPWVPDYAYGEDLNEKSLLNRLNRNITKKTMRLAARRYDLLIANSKFTKHVLTDSVGVDSKDVKVARYGVDHNVFRPYNGSTSQNTLNQVAASTPFILYVANYTPRKSPETVIRSFAELRDRGLEHELVIVGGGYHESAITNRTDKLGIDEHVAFTGFLNEKEIAHLYSACDVFVFPTLHETFGMPVLEAMASGAPVVSSNCTAIPEVAGNAAHLIDDPTDPIELADIVRDIIENPAIKQQMVKDGIQRSRKFSWEQTADRINELLFELNN